MIPDHHGRIEELFDRFVDDEGAGRLARLEAACAGDAELFAEVSALLDADVDAHPILRADAAVLAGSLLDTGGRPMIPGRFGRYIILKHLADGGMGSVYLAQRDGLDDQVAVKFLHDPWSSPARRRRFASEQRTLAALKHPGIARLYDAGVENGAPWFAMEYVPGHSIVRYCQTNRLPLRGRLELFRAACEAVAYAHRNLTLHLDLKPSNVLVTDEGEVKLVDFGIARHIGRDGGSAERTATGQRLLSLSYAAPEQLRGEAVDVQADVYSLGAVLHELLVGRPPFELSTAGSIELASLLAGDPVRPSVYAGGDPRGVTASRNDWKDLDVLCLTALRHEKAQRYQSVDRLVDDIDHLLRDEPLEARAAAGFLHRLRKFLRRHRRPVAAAGAAVATVVGLTAFFTVRLVDARNQAVSSESRLQRVHRVMLNLFEGDDDAAGPAESLRVVSLLDRGVREADGLSGDPDLQAELRSTFGGLYHKLGHLDKAEPLLVAAAASQAERLGRDHPQTVRTQLALAGLRVDLSEIEEAQKLVNESLTLVTRRYPPDSFEVGTAIAMHGKVLFAKGEYPAAVARLDSAIDTLSRFPPSTALSEALGDLGNSHYALGHIEDSERVNRRALNLDRELYGNRHPFVGVDLYNLGNIALDRGEYRDGEGLFRQALGLYEAWYGHSHPKTASATLMVGRALAYEGKLEEADRFYVRARDAMREAYTENHVRYASVLSLMGDLNRDRNRLDEAEHLFTAAAAILKRLTGERHEFYLHQLSNLGSVYLERQQYQRAEATLRIATSGLLAAVPDQRYTALAQVRLGRALAGQARYDEAEQQTAAGYSTLLKLGNASTVEVQDARRELVRIYRLLGQPARAVELERMSAAAREKRKAAD